MGSYFDARDDQYEPLFGGQNTTRVPAFYQIDARSSAPSPSPITAPTCSSTSTT